jgi:hypothetical protein
MALLLPQGKQVYADSAGDPLAGGLLYTYAAGTSTPLATYSSQAGTIPNANPVVLDSRGEATVFWSGASYKVVLHDSADAPIWTQDNVGPEAVTATGADTARTQADWQGAVKGWRSPAEWGNHAALTGAHLASAAAQAVTDGVGLLIAHPVTISTAIDLGTVPIRVEGRGKFVRSGSGTLTGTGPLTAPIGQIFDGWSSGLTFSWKVEHVVPQWWGAVGDGVTDDTAAIQAADARAAPTGRPTVFPTGTYKMTSSTIFAGPVVMSSGARIQVADPSVYLKFNGQFDAGMDYVLDTDGPTQFLAVERILPQWFGVCGGLGDDSSVPMTRAFRAARAAAASATGVPDRSYGARRVHFVSGLYRCSDVPVYCGTVVTGDWQGSLFGSTIQQILATAPALRIMPKNYGLDNSVLNNSVGQNNFSRVGFRSEVFYSVSQASPILYFMSPAQATTYLGVAGDTAGTVGHVDTMFTDCWWKDHNDGMMADDGAFVVHLRGCVFDVGAKAVRHTGTAWGSVRSTANFYYGQLRGAFDNTTTDATVGVSWESYNDKVKAGTTASADATFRHALTYNPSVAVAGTYVIIEGSVFMRTDGLGVRVGGPIFLKGVELVDMDVTMIDPDSADYQKAIRIQAGTKHLSLRGTIISKELASYTNARLVTFSQDPVDLLGAEIDMKCINTSASAIEAAFQSDYVLTGCDFHACQAIGAFTRPLNTNITETRGFKLSASKGYDPPSLATGTRATATTLTVVGANLGDDVSATFSLDLEGMDLVAWVSATDTVSVIFVNGTAGTLDLAAGTLAVTIRKK